MAKKPRAENPVVGLVQMTCDPKPERNLKKALARIGDAARAAPRSSACRSSSARSTSARRRTRARFDLAEPIPGPTTEAAGERRRGSSGRRDRRSLFERRAAGLYHNTAVVLDATARIAGTTARCTSPTTRSTTRSSTSRPATSASSVRHRRRPHRRARLLGPVVPRRRAPDGARGRGDALLPDRDRLAAGREGREDAAEHEAWETVQRAHAIANGVFVVAVNRVGREGDLQFWGSSFVADPFGRIIAQASATEERRSSSPIDLARIERRGGTGPSCATAASTRTATSRSGSSIPGRSSDERARRPRALGYACRPSGSRTRRRGSRGRKDPVTWPGRVPQVEASSSG